MSQGVFEEILSQEKLYPYMNWNSEIKISDVQSSCLDSFAENFVDNIMDRVFKDYATKSCGKIMEFSETRNEIHEEIPSIVQSLRNIEIGDSYFIMKTASLEKIVKETIDSLHSNEIIKPIFIDGQGDASIKSLSESSIINELITVKVSRSRNKIWSKHQKEMVLESSCFLQKIIEEIEKQEFKSKIHKVTKRVIDPIVEEEISIWEENEEELIRVIEASEMENNIDNIDDEEKEEFFEQSIGEMTFMGREPKLSSSFSTKVSFPESEFVEEIKTEEVGSFPLFLYTEDPKLSSAPPLKFLLPPLAVGGLEFEAKDNCNAHKFEQSKKWFSNKLRKFLRFILGRNKY